MGDERQGRGESRPKSKEGTDYYAEFTREEWIAYLADRVTPAYAGWADNFSAQGQETAERGDAEVAEKE